MFTFLLHLKDYITDYVTSMIFFFFLRVVQIEETVSTSSTYSFKNMIVYKKNI